MLAWPLDSSSYVARVRAEAEDSRAFPSACFSWTLIGVRLQPFHLKALDAWIAKQKPPVTRPEAIRGMIETVLHILSKDPGEKPRKAKQK